MATLGKPQINQLRSLELRTINAVLTAIQNRFLVLEALLQGPTSLNVADTLANLLKQPDGLVVKVNGALATATADAGLVLTQPTGALTGYQLSLDFDTPNDGLVVRTSTGLTARTLQAASGYAGAITNPDGVTGDPTFHS